MARLEACRHQRSTAEIGSACARAEAGRTMTLDKDPADRLAHCEKLLAAYDAVIEDISDWTECEGEWQFVKTRLDWMRTDIVEAIGDMKSGEVSP